MMMKRIQTYALLLLLGCAVQQTTHPMAVVNAIRRTADRIRTSETYDCFERVCQAIAGYTIFKSIKHVGTREAFKMCTAEPLVTPLACYALVPVVKRVLDWGYRKAFEGYNNDVPGTGIAMVALGETYRSVDLLRVAPLLYFLSFVKP